MNQLVQQSIEKIKAKPTSHSLLIPESATLEQWSEIGKALYHAGQTMTWWLADWAAFGDRKYGKLKEFCELNEFNYQSISNARWVASAVEISRRRENLSFGHHAEVAALPAKDQKKWLAKAEKEKLSIVELRRQIRQSTCIYPPEKTFGPSPDFIQIEKIFLDASDTFSQKMDYIKTHSEEVFNKAVPLLKKAQEIWPEKIQIKA